MKRYFFLPVLAVLFLFSSPFAEARPEKVFRVSDGRVITFDQMVADLKRVSVVFVGEQHDDPRHHDAQLAIIRAFHESEKPVAIGLEMFRAENQPALDSWVKGKLPLKKFLPVYYDNWTLPWPLYSPIFEYAREHEVPIQGLNIPSAISKKVARSGFSSLTAKEKKQLPPGISCNVDPKYMEFIKRAYAGHAGHQDREFVNFCEAQMIWDKSMAWHLSGYLKKKPDMSMVVLAGIGHAWKRGISEQLEPFARLSYRVVLPAVPDQIDRESVTTHDADYVILD